MASNPHLDIYVNPRELLRLARDLRAEVLRDLDTLEYYILIKSGETAIYIRTN